MITFQKSLLLGPTGNQLKEDRRGQFATREEEEEEESKEAVGLYFSKSFNTFPPWGPWGTLTTIKPLSFLLSRTALKPGVLLFLYVFLLFL